MPSIQERVTSALLSGSSQVTRRTEIYEADGTTLFASSDSTPRIIDGSVSVDYGRDERRALDCTFDNSDGLLRHDPDGFWYDKVIKVYRGTQWYETTTTPKIAVIENQDATPTLIPALRRLGFTDITTVNAASYADVDQYDIVMANGSNTGELSSKTYTILSAAYAAGKEVFTIGSQLLSIPLYTSAVSKSDAAAWTATPVAADNPFLGRWSTITTSVTSTGVLPSVLASDTVSVGTMTWSATPYTVLMYQTNKVGGRWFHSQLPYQSNTQFNQLLDAVFLWLYPLGGFQSWETQIGEFMIDRIVQQRFPQLIKVTGRDYAKKLLKAKFTNSLTFSAGQDLKTVLSAIAANGGVTKLNINTDGATLEQSMTFDRTTERWKAMKDLAATASLDVYFDKAGYLVARRMQDPSTSPTTLTLQTGVAVGNLVDYEKSSNDSRLYNRVIVTSENAEVLAANPYGLQVIVANTEPASPTRVARIGQRDYFYTSSFFTNTDQMTSYAKSLLKIVALEEFELDFSAIPFYWSEAGDIIQFLDPDAGVDEPTRYLMSTFNIPLSLGPMTGNARRVTIVGQAS